MGNVYEVAQKIHERLFAEIIGVLNGAANDFEKEPSPRTARTDLSDASEQRIKKGQQIDPRPIKMMMKSGKGDRRHEDSLNVTLFDHSLTVALGGAHLAILHYLMDDVDEETVVRIAKILIAVGFMHDIDKYFDKDGADLTAADVLTFCDEWNLMPWINSAYPGLSPAMVLSLIRAYETRTAIISSEIGTPDKLISACRLFGRLADSMESKFAKAWRGNGFEAITNGWNAAKDAIGSGIVADLEPIIVTDVHHPFLLDTLLFSLSSACWEVTKMPPVFESQIDGTMFALIQKEKRKEIVALTLKYFKNYLSKGFGSSIFIKPQGNVDQQGAAPTSDTLGELIRKQLLESDAHRLLTVKSAEVANKDNPGLWPKIQAAAIAAGLQPIEKPSTTASTYVTKKFDENDGGLDEMILACKIAYIVSVEEFSKNKKLKKENRLQELMDIFEIEGLEDKYNFLTRRSYGALKIAEKIRLQGADGESILDAYVAEKLSENGIFELYEDKATDAVNAAIRHFSALLNGESIDYLGDGNCCLITGLPTTKKWMIKAPDDLYALKSCAFSYRPGRSEFKTREVADAFIHPVSYVEFRLRQRANDVMPTGVKDEGVPVKAYSPISNGFFGAKFRVNQPQAQDVSSYNMMTLDKKKSFVEAINCFAEPTRFVKFETLPNKFSEKVSFFLRVLNGSLRLGKPIHIFGGLPTPQPGFFYSDCLGRDIENLLGGQELRVEEMRTAISKLELVLFLAKSKSDGGLSEVGLAKALCYPATSFKAAVLAWFINENSDKFDSNMQSKLVEFIEKEIKQMRDMNVTAPELKLSEIAATIQRKLIYSDSMSMQEFLLRKCFEEAESAFAAGRGKDREYLIARISQSIYADADRRHKSSGFFSAKTTRSEGETIESQITLFVTTFVDDMWAGLYHNRPCRSEMKRAAIATYVYGLKAMASKTQIETQE